MVSERTTTAAGEGGTHDGPTRHLVTRCLFPCVVNDEVEEDVEAAKVARDLAVPLPGVGGQVSTRSDATRHVVVTKSPGAYTLTKTSLSMY